jgi:hypothetical protein
MPVHAAKGFVICAYQPKNYLGAYEYGHGELTAPLRRFLIQYLPSIELHQLTSPSRPLTSFLHNQRQETQGRCKGANMRANR